MRSRVSGVRRSCDTVASMRRWVSKSDFSCRDRSLNTLAVSRTSRVPRSSSSWGGATAMPTPAVGDSDWPSNRAASLSRRIGSDSARAAIQAASATAMILMTASSPSEIHGGCPPFGPIGCARVTPAPEAGWATWDRIGFSDCPIDRSVIQGGGGAVARNTSKARNELIENATSSSRKIRRKRVSTFFSVKAAVSGALQ
jgi:hypothetical protein